MSCRKCGNDRYYIACANCGTDLHTRGEVKLPLDPRLKEVMNDIRKMPIHEVSFEKTAVNIYGDKREKTMKNKIVATMLDYFPELEGK